MCVYLRAKFEVTVIILTRSRQGGVRFTSPSAPQNEPLKGKGLTAFAERFLKLVRPGILCITSFWSLIVNFEHISQLI